MILDLPIWAVIVLGLLLALGVVMVLIIIWLIIDEVRGGSPAPFEVNPYHKGQNDTAIKYLDNEVRGQMRKEFSMYRGMAPIDEPTLKGRVDMIEQHLGIKVEVKPMQEAKLVVRKVKK